MAEPPKNGVQKVIFLSDVNFNGINFENKNTFIHQSAYIIKARFFNDTLLYKANWPCFCKLDKIILYG